ncbi:hypothetical protein CHUAL_000791 [Chamberlinius hualienensis]
MSSASTSKSNEFLLLYGSQTGQAEAITEDIENTAFDHGLVANRYCMSLTDKKFSIEEAVLAVIVVSTTGEGDPPDTVQKIWKRLKKSTVEKDILKKLRYALLGLGDSNYGMFCNCARMFDSRLEELGATKFYKTGYADDATGLEIVVEPWIEGLWTALKTELNINEKSDQATISNNSTLLKSDSDSVTVTNTLISTESSIQKSVEPLASCKLTLPPFTSPPYKLVSSEVTDSDLSWKKPSHILAASDVNEVSAVALNNLTNHDLVKKTLELQLDISGTGLNYDPGDAFGVYAPNDSTEVDWLLDRLELKEQSKTVYRLTAVQTDTGKRPVTIPKHIPPTFTTFELFTHLCDIRTVVKKKFLRVLSSYCSNDADKRRLEELSSVEGGEEFTKFVIIPMLSLLDVLLNFPSCSPPVECLIEYLPPLQPRFYSAASSPLVNEDRLTFVFRLVEISAEDGRRYSRLGICTGWFSKLFQKSVVTGGKSSETDLVEAVTNLNLNFTLKVKIFLRKSHHFHLPSSISQPMILIGPGTGIAPFIGFLEHRQSQLSNNSGLIWLFFGCRYREHDYLYRKQLEGFVDSGVLSTLLPSFSRDRLEDEPKYVQDNIWQHREMLVKLLNEKDAAIYVCGDAKGMAKDVYETFNRSLIDQLKLSDAESRAYIRKLQDNKRYITDVWI